MKLLLFLARAVPIAALVHNLETRQSNTREWKIVYSYLGEWQWLLVSKVVAGPTENCLYC